MKKLILIALTVMMMSSSVYAGGIDFDQQNFDLDLVSVGDGDC